jgi:hypothetical protein
MKNTRNSLLSHCCGMSICSSVVSTLQYILTVSLADIRVHFSVAHNIDQPSTKARPSTTTAWNGQNDAPFSSPQSDRIADTKGTSSSELSSWLWLSVSAGVHALFVRQSPSGVDEKRDTAAAACSFLASARPITSLAANAN